MYYRAEELQDDGHQETTQFLTDEEITRELARISAKHGFTEPGLADVADLFRRAGHVKVPKDPRTIKKTRTEPVGDVDFVHLGLVRGILQKTTKGLHPNEVHFFFFC